MEAERVDNIQLNTIFNMDCLEGMKMISDKSVDMIFTDLPFGTTNCSWDSVIPLDQLWEQYERIIKDNGAILLFGQTPFDKVLGASNVKLLRYEWIWEKTAATGHLNAKKMPMKAHENILVFYKKLPTYNPQKTTGHKRKVSTAVHKRNSKKSDVYNDYSLTDYDSTERYPRSVLKYPSDKQTLNLHPTQKPIALVEDMIKTYSNEGETILDSCSGSATFAIACIRNNRNYVGFETEEKYWTLGNERIENEFVTA